MQVAAQAARSGHGNFARELRKLVDEAKTKAHCERRVDNVRSGPRRAWRREFKPVAALERRSV